MKDALGTYEAKNARQKLVSLMMTMKEKVDRDLPHIYLLEEFSSCPGPS
jgi:hypothetical protein